MAEGAQGVPYPSVFVVDSHTGYPSLPPKPKAPRRGLGAAQILLFLLVSLALCGMAIEACFIYRLYHPDSVASASAYSSIQDKQDIYVPPPTKRPYSVVLPSKPVAHLNAGPQPPKGELMQWNMDSDPLLFQMKYSDGRLTIQREGYYYVYSKVFYYESNHGFTHSVRIITPKYLGKNITILQSRRYHPFNKSGKDSMSSSNSFLGGVFHLHKHDSLVVMVSNTSQIFLAFAYENYFGSYML